MKTVKSGIIFLCLTISWFVTPLAHAQWTEVDLCTFPDTGLAVADGTILDNQWRPIGILFDVVPAFVDPIMKDWGSCHLFFNPDVFGVTAVFNFVKPGTTVSTNALGFKLDAWYQLGESAQLVGLDSTGNVIAQDQITPADIGLGNKTLGMTIIGSFHTVEWRTQGDPGIAANGIEFELKLPPFPWTMFLPAMTRGEW